jgi:AraC-like DNA-binding protein
MINLHDFISGSNHFRKFEVDDLLFVEYTCLVDDSRSEIWSHTNYFAFVLNGKKMWKTLKNEYLIKSEDLIFVKKGATCVYQYFEEKFYVLFVFIPDDFINWVVKKHLVKSLPVKRSATEETDKVIVLDPNEIFTAYFHSLLLYFRQPAPPSKALLKTKLEELILSMLYYGSNQELAHYFKEVCSNANLSMQEVMESNFHKKLSLNEFARLCARSLSVFKRDFSSQYGSSPGKWLTEKRLEYSRYLLEITGKDIEEVVLESGFTNRSHFIRVFKEKFGVTPLQFRKTEQS